MKVAIVHDWLNGMRGGENVLEALIEIWPEASIFTLFYDPRRVSPAIRSRPISVSYLNRIPGIRRNYRYFLGLFPRAIESLNLGNPDLVISSSHAVAKGVRPGSALHICYCHTPMRYIWDALEDYNPGILQRAGLSMIRRRLRAWDRDTSQFVHHFIANSRFVADRIQSCYGREATLIHPPVDTVTFTPPRQEEDFFLWVGALVAYKKPELAIDAFNGTHRRLVIAGSGPEEKRLMGMAGPNIEFSGWLSPNGVRNLYRRARAVIFPGKEDFGIVPIEARACGCPVIAYNAGGAPETLQDGINSILFSTQTVRDLRHALERFDNIEWSESSVRKGTELFSRERFKSEMESFVERCWNARGESNEVGSSSR